MEAGNEQKAPHERPPAAFYTRCSDNMGLAGLETNVVWRAMPLHRFAKLSAA
jgi:hypothetical protein